jgi:hypothetical protein
MITLKRDREKHEIEGRLKYRIPGGLRGGYLHQKNLKLLELKRKNGTLVSDDFKNSYWKPAKEALKAESFNKCAYCEAPTAVVAHGDIEHYRPKSTYWWLAYCYDNYLYSCQLCNQVYKVDHFPIQNARLAEPPVNHETTDAEFALLKTQLCPDPIKVTEEYPLVMYIQDCLAERPLLLNPYMENPAEYMAWEAKPVLKEVRLVSANESEFATAAVEAMERYYGLNREELCRLRWECYDILREFHKDLQDTNLSADRRAEKRRKLKSLIGESYLFSGMAQYFVYKVWKINLDES